MSKVKIGYMCDTEFDHHLENDVHGSKIYPSKKSLLANSKCTEEGIRPCKLIKVEIRTISEPPPKKEESDEPKYHLIKNAIVTPDGTELRSYQRHDYKTHLDKNGKTYMIDGGLDYSRRSANGDEVDACVYSDAPHSIQRYLLHWGSYGKDGDQPLKHIKIADMESEHMKAVINGCTPHHTLEECMRKELADRNE
jgi:hypothetical protein